MSDTDFRGRTVLEIGTSDGFLGYELERRGARVWAVDIPLGETYDMMPPDDARAAEPKRKAVLQIVRARNAFWLSHRLHRSAVRLIEARVDRLPPALGQVECCFLGNVLQHLENPLRALTEAARLASYRVIVTEANWRPDLDPDAALLAAFLEPRDDTGRRGYFSWFQPTPGLVERWLERLGFAIVSRTVHEQRFVQDSSDVPHFTVVAQRRTLPAAGA